MRQFKDTLNPLQPSWDPSQIRAGPKAATDEGAQPGGIHKDGVYAPHWAHVHASDPALNPLLDSRAVMFDVVDSDSDGFVSGQTQIDRLIVPVTLGGVYLIMAQADSEESSNNTVQGIVLMVNGSIGIAKCEVRQQGTTGSSFNAIAIWQLNDGDYVQVQYSDEAPSPSSYLKVVEPGTPSLALLRVGG